MAENPHLAYLTLLNEVGCNLDRLSGLARQKTEAVRRDNLEALGEVLKQEQALSLALRGQEQKRLKLLGQLGLEKTSLSDLAARYPAELQPQAVQTATSLREKYGAYRAATREARSMLERNLRQVEQVIADLGVVPAEEGAGYAPPQNPEPPKRMKTDFRA